MDQPQGNSVLVSVPKKFKTNRDKLLHVYVTAPTESGDLTGCFCETGSSGELFERQWLRAAAWGTAAAVGQSGAALQLELHWAPCSHNAYFRMWKPEK